MFDYLCYQPIDSYTPKQDSTPLSYIRILQESQGLKAADVYFNSRPAVKKLRFKKFTPYFNIPAGQYRMDVFKAGMVSNSLANIEFTLNPGLIYTAIIEGAAGNRLLLVEDSRIKAAEGITNIRFINICPEMSSFEAVPSGVGAPFQGIYYRVIPEYKAIKPGKYTFFIKPDNMSKSVLAIPDLSLNSEWNYTIYISGMPGTKSGLQAILLIDGNTYIK